MRRFDIEMMAQQVQTNVTCDESFFHQIIGWISPYTRFRYVPGESITRLMNREFLQFLPLDQSYPS